MKLRPVVDGLFEIPLEGVNAHVIDAGDALILVDTGSAGSETSVFGALRQLGREPAELTHIIVTHCHPDHAGSLGAVQGQTRAVTIMHPLDAALVQEGRSLRSLAPAPGLLTRLLFSLFIAPAPATITAAGVDQLVEEGAVLPVAGGLRIIHTPGHSAGQIALLWEPAGVLLAADAVMNRPRLGYSLGYEDFDVGRQTASRLASFDFDTACFGHGQPLVGRAASRFRRKFA